MIIVFGSLNMDLLMEVPVLPEPGQTVLSPGYVVKPGGKGNNQAVAAARAGAEVMMVGRVGEDDFGRQLIGNLNANGVNAAGVKTCGEPTGIACVCVDHSGANFITVGTGANRLAQASQIPEAALHSAGTTLVMQMEVPAEENWALIDHAGECGATTLLNVAPAAAVPPNVLTKLDYLIVNEVEAEPVATAIGVPAGDPLSTAQAIARHGDLTCVITLGKAGSVAAGPSGAWTVEAMQIVPVDTTGAGDAFTAVFAAALDETDDLSTALHRATVAAALTCLALGAQESLPTATAIDSSIARVPKPRQIV